MTFADFGKRAGDISHFISIQAIITYFDSLTSQNIIFIFPAQPVKLRFSLQAPHQLFKAHGPYSEQYKNKPLLARRFKNKKKRIVTELIHEPLSE